MIVTPEFPEHRLQDPRRQAEWRVYQEIAGSQAPGRALYEMRAGLHAPQLDFGIWLQDVAHYGLQVKGGGPGFVGIPPDLVRQAQVQPPPAAPPSSKSSATAQWDTSPWRPRHGRRREK